MPVDRSDVYICTEADEFMVPCPVCRGTKLSPYIQQKTCGCCDGEGQITAERDKILSQIRRDLAARMETR